MAEEDILRRDERELDYASVRDLDLKTLRTIFIRLVPRGDIADVDDITTFSVEADVTVDEVDGKVVGVNITWFKES